MDIKREGKKRATTLPDFADQAAISALWCCLLFWGVTIKERLKGDLQCLSDGCVSLRSSFSWCSGAKSMKSGNLPVSTRGWLARWLSGGIDFLVKESLGRLKKLFCAVRKFNAHSFAALELLFSAWQSWPANTSSLFTGSLLTSWQALSVEGRLCLLFLLYADNSEHEKSQLHW